MPFPIAPLRQLSESNMTEYTEVLRAVDSVDEEGYPRTVWSAAISTKSYGSPLGSRELMRANQAGIEASQTRYLPIGVNVTSADRLRVGSVIYEISGISEGTEALMADIEMFVKEAYDSGLSRITKNADLRWRVL